MIKITTKKRLPIVQFARSANTPIGDLFLLLVIHFGFDYTLTKGILSGKNRTLSTEDNQYKQVLQTDAAIKSR